MLQLYVCILHGAIDWKIFWVSGTKSEVGSVRIYNLVKLVME